MKPKTKKAPVVRRGQRVPYVKSTNAQIEEMVESVARMLVMQASKTEVHKAVAIKYRKDWRTCDVYISRAKALLRKRAQISQSDAKELGVNVIMEVLRTGNATQRLAAERRFGEIFGYDAPRRTEVSGPAGGPIQAEVEAKRDLPSMVVRVMDALRGDAQVRVLAEQGRLFWRDPCVSSMSRGNGKPQPSLDGDKTPAGP